MRPRILAVDDDSMILNAMKTVFSGSRFELDVASSAHECLRLVKQSPLRYAVVFVDYNLTHDGGSLEQRGDGLARKLKSINPQIIVVMVSGDTSPDAFSAWLSAGVDQYLYKPVRAHQVLAIAEAGYSKYEAAVGASSNRDSSLERSSEAKEALRKVGLVSASVAMGRAAKLAVTFAQHDYNVLILGETGTGKEVIAQAIHRLSDRSKKPFLAINCSSYKNSENLLESELFGYEKGAFTGADRLKIGIFEAAQGGVIFLDEIHHLGPGAQAKLLRVIQERKIRRVGGAVEIPVKFRLIAAGKPELHEMSREGTFTGDLYYRIKELLLEVPPLRERPEDVRPLVMHFKTSFEHDLGRRLEFTESAFKALQNHQWPGNVRELLVLVKGLAVTADGPIIRPEDLPREYRPAGENVLLRNKKLMSFDLLVAEQEVQQRELIRLALEETQGNVSQAAAVLNIARSTMRDLMRRFGLDESKSEPARSINQAARGLQKIT